MILLTALSHDWELRHKKNVQKSVEWIKNVLGIEPEVFTYYVIPEINDKVDFRDP